MTILLMKAHFWESERFPLPRWGSWQVPGNLWSSEDTRNFPCIRIGRVNKRTAMLELDPIPLLGGLLEILHQALKKNKNPPLAIY
jgi:hypothetical protein